jgi:hypothetical protein
LLLLLLLLLVVVVVVCFQYHFASDKPPPPSHLTAVSDCLWCYHEYQAKWLYTVIHVFILYGCGGLNYFCFQKLEFSNLLDPSMHSIPYGVPWPALKG